MRLLKRREEKRREEKRREEIMICVTSKQMALTR
jgi:hypothetical protein